VPTISASVSWLSPEITVAFLAEMSKQQQNQSESLFPRFEEWCYKLFQNPIFDHLSY
jgi:hypothetical protein